MKFGLDIPWDPGNDIGYVMFQEVRHSRFALCVYQAKGVIFFAFLCVSEHFEPIKTHFFWKIFVSVKRT